MASPLRKPVPFETSEDLTGTTIGRFAIRERLGAGGMGEVYLADDTTLKRRVAVKRLSSRLREDPRYHRRFLHEAERASALNSRHIAGIHDVLELGGHLYLVMEYVEGANLRHRLQQPVSLSDFLKISLQCAEALVAAHEKGIVHRDIKPENIMLTPAGEVKMLDFGLAKRLALSEETLASSQLESRTGGFAGTPGYMAPELVLETEPDGRADIFSLGVVFHEMLYGRHPFLARKLVVTPGGIAHEVPSPAAGGKHVPPPLQGLVSRMLAKDPADRCASAREVLDELRTIWHQTTNPQLAPSQELPAGLRPWPAKRIVSWAFAAVLVAVVAVVTWRAFQPVVPAQRIRVAVLPFSNQTGNASLERFRMTLTQMMVLDLTGSPNIQVLSYERLLELNRGFEAGGKDIYQPEAIQAVANYSGSRFVVVPSMFAAGNTMRLSAEFRDPRSGETAATAKVERPLSGSPEETFYSMQDELAGRIQDYFKDAGPGQDYEVRSPAARPRSVAAAYDYTEGRNAIAQGNYARAIGFLKRAIDSDPEFALAYARMGQVYGTLGYDDRARPLAEKASQLIRPETPVIDALFIQANLAERVYDFSEAERKYLERIRLYPDDPDAHAGLASVLMRQGRYAEAISRSQEALRLDPNYVVAHGYLGDLYARTGAFQKAVEHGQRALQLCRAIGNREAEADVLLGLGEIHLLSGELPKALQMGQEALRLAQSLAYESSILSAEKFLGDVLASQAKYEEARRHYLAVIETSAEVRNNRLQAQTLMNVGVTHWNQGDLARAVEYFEKSLAQGRRYGEYRDPPSLRERGQALTNLGAILIEYGPDPERGVRYVREALSLFQSMGEVRWEATNRLHVGNYSLNTGFFQQANHSLQQSRDLFAKVQAAPAVTQATYVQARAFFFQHRYQQARLAADAALARARDEQTPFQVPNVQILSGWIYLRLGDTARARSLLEEGLATAQKNGYGELLPDAYAALGELYLESGDRGRARSYLQQGAALSEGPSVAEASIEARSALGLLLVAQGATEPGLSECRSALELARRLQHRHTTARAILNLAEVHHLRNEHTRVLEVLDELLTSTADLGNEWRARAHYLQALALENLGRKEQAIAVRQRARDAVLHLQRELDATHRQSFAARRGIRAILEEQPGGRASWRSPLVWTTESVGVGRASS
ncbi:MAG: tetratricopeptide repeat protein [Acidobacteria bacterium]|nr:tetratricopeptide repeat protein [Acidobacteriota bacterium]